MMRSASRSNPFAAAHGSHRVKALVEDIADAGVWIHAAVGTPPPRPADDEIGWTTDTDDVNGW